VPYKPRAWEDTPFRNSARTDGLILRHWRRKGDVGSVGAAMPVTPADSNAASEMDTDDKPITPIPDSPWAKYNVKIDKPKYTNEQYEAQMKNEDWSKEETDYLVDLAYEYDLRWIVIGDRYEYRPSKRSEESEDAVIEAKPRTQEDLRARYYDVAAKAMVLQNPLSSMSSSEFDAYEKMTKFDAGKETQRKKYAEQLMQRTDEDKNEEEMLLKELSRIVLNQETLFADRKALYDRLEPATSTSRDNFSTAMYQSSQGLSTLYANLLMQNRAKDLEKKEKRRSAMEAGDMSGGMDRSQRHNMGGADKRASTSGDTGRRQLSARDESKYGVGHPNERLTGGVQFRNERVAKAVQGKSHAKTEKIAAALTELKMPPKLVMPTAKVVTEYENLVEKIKTLVEVRRVSEKLESETKVFKAQRELQEAKDRGEDVKEEEPSSQTAAGNDDEDNDEEEEEEEEESKLETSQLEDESKIDDNNEIEIENEVSYKADNDNDNDNNDVENDSDPDAEDQEDSNSDESEEDDAEPDVDPDPDAADEMRDLQEDDEGGEDQEEEQKQELEPNVDLDEDEDEDGDEVIEEEEDAGSPPASPAPTATTTTKGEGARKRSASVVSHVSNRSSKRQRK
jgi:DNA methyltransferase 1-associated protein 1